MQNSTKTKPGGGSAKAIKYAELVVKNTKAKKPKNKGQLMREAGYAEISCRKPYAVELSKAYQDRIKELIPEDTATKIHKKLLNASVLIEKSFPVDLTDKEIRKIVNAVGGKLIKVIEQHYGGEDGEGYSKKIAYFRMSDCKVQDSALDKYYRVISGYAPEKIERRNFDMAALHKQIYGDNGTEN